MNRFRRLPRPASLLGAVWAAVRRRPRRALAGLVILGVVVIAIGGRTLVSTAPPPGGTPATSFTYTGSWTLLDLERHIDAGEVAAISVPALSTVDEGDAGGAAGASLAVRTRDGQVIKVELTTTAANAAAGLAALGHGSLFTSEAWQAAGQAAVAQPAPAGSDPIRTLLSVVVPVLLLVVVTILVLRLMRSGAMGRSDTRSTFQTIHPRTVETNEAATAGAAGPAGGAGEPPSGGVRLADVAGCDEAKRELTETIDFLTNPERFRRLGAHIPRGTLLFGPPGTGKTMLAKAVATEAQVPFIYVSGSEFVEKYVGVGARRVRDLFAHARRLGRAVVFFDEFDALAKTRGGANSHEEREQTLNQLLVELDGFSSTEEVVIIAATNRLDVLDHAVLRPGRFNRKIHVGLPDVAGRREILAVHAAGKPIAPEADLDAVARRTYGFSGAQLADVLNEAAILAARREADQIEPDDLHGGWLKVAIGTGRKRSMDERERSIIAAHEVGHAICGRVHGDKRKVEEISLFAHGEALGVTVSSQEDNDLPAESDLRARLVALMGGRAAEELLFQEVTGGASNDFDKANQIATSMVTKWGMGRDPDATDAGMSGRGQLGFLVARGTGSLPTEVQPAATRAIRAILDEAYERACDTLLEHMPTLRRIAAYLVVHERVDGLTFDALFEGELAAGGAEAEWRPLTARPRDWTDIAPFRERRRLAVAAAMATPTSEPTEPVLVPAPASAVADLGSKRAIEPAATPTIAPQPPITLEAGEPRLERRRPADRSPGGPLRRPRGGSGRRVAGRIERRLRGLAGDALHRAEVWLGPGRPELDDR